jgi:hypothetical protein
MSVHDRAAANYARRFTLTVCKCDSHCMQSWEISRLTAAEVEAEKANCRELYIDAYPPGKSPFTLSFDVEAT